MTMPSIRSIQTLPVTLPRPLSGAAVVRFDKNHFSLVGPGILDVLVTDEGDIDFEETVSPSAYPVKLVTAAKGSRGGVLTYGGVTTTGGFYDTKVRWWGLSSGSLLAETGIPLARKGMGAIRSGSRVLVFGGQDATGRALKSGFMHLEGEDPGFEDDLFPPVSLEAGEIPSAGGLVLPQVVVCRPGGPGTHRRVLVLNTGRPYPYELVQRHGETALLLAQDIALPFAQRNGAACSLFGGRGFALAPGLNGQNQASKSLILWDGSGSPAVAGEQLPTELIAPCLLRVSDTAFLVMGGDTNQGVEASTVNLAVFRVDVNP